MSRLVAAYLRASQDHDGEEFSVETQRRRISDEVKRRGWTVVKEFVDNSVSASKSRGEGTTWHDMLGAIGTGQFDVIVAIDLDRLLRQTKDLVTLIEANGRVLTLDGEIDLSTPDGELRATMLAGFARFEVRLKAERMRRANERRRKDGVPLKVGMKILGFTRDGLEVVEDEAKAVRKVFVDFLAGVSLNQLAKDMTAAGWRTSKGRDFNAHSIRTMLRNPRYIGKILFHATGELYPGNFPAIVDPDTFRATQGKLDDPARRKSKGNEPTQLLSSIAYCGVCLQRSIKVGRADWVFYRCNAGHVSRSLRMVDAMVEAAVITRLSADDAIDMFAPETGPDIDRDALREERITKESRLHGLSALYSEGFLDADGVREQSALLRQRITEIDGLLKTPGPSLIQELVDADDVEAAWKEMDLVRQRLVVQELMTVTIMPTKKRGKGFDPDSISIEPRK